MANKARYYGIVKKEQQDLKKRAQKGGGFINPEELTAWSVYSAMAKVPNIDEMSAQAAAKRIKFVVEDADFQGTIIVKGVQISDGSNTYILTKTKEGIQIAKEIHEEKQRRK